MVRTLERTVEQIVDVQATQVMEKTTKNPENHAASCEHTVPTEEGLMTGPSESLNNFLYAQVQPVVHRVDFPDTFDLEKRVHLNLVIHNPIVIHFSQ